MKNYLPQHDHDGDMRRLAHDLRNSMSVVYANMQLLEIYLEREGVLKEKQIIASVLREIRKMNSRITEAANELSKEDELLKKPSD